MKSILPIGVLVPTRNCAPLLRRQMPSLCESLQMAEEVVVVDSFSTDGTLECLRANLHHPRLRFFSRPPGLYEAWNFGIDQLSTEYAYISTAGDAITCEGLHHLVDVGERMKADVVVSPPRFVDDRGGGITSCQWPIHRFIEAAGIDQPVRIPSWQAFLATSLEVPAGLLGSSASNLYRTVALKQHPFCTDFGHSSDTAWTVRNALSLQWSVTPRTFSEFVMHDGLAPMTATEASALEARFLALVDEVLETSALRHPSCVDGERAVTLWQKCRRNRLRLHDAQCELRRLRTKDVPWFLDPRGWIARCRRNTARAALSEFRRQLISMPALG